MGNQLNLFDQIQMKRYEVFKKHFYRGVKERQEKAMREFRANKYERISILIKPINK